ncbi:hypothetical protein BBD42_25095 [Paenibacillus sp. BIHB 4019]|uniref:Uncharacterized protein n=1 Tax=Paenibacillus sp. BIHB 4019 TaxID=1870819 RepID=A0A1B2DNV4_9BACL|nr:hypothetical protein [Paenibacillus sp. BIHB 4019]ANY69395.1 hypothetical protein BBD42_25095 [Paenibacillus sp. BIHB 4019]
MILFKNRLSKAAMGIMMIASLLFSTTTYAAPTISKGIALTAPPPSTFSLKGFMNPSHIYLLDGTNRITKVNNQAVTLSGYTYGYYQLDSLGITFYLERWTGNEWVTHGTGVNRSDLNKDTFSSSVTMSANSGYYYRVRTIHWVIEDGNYEQGQVISEHILVS